MGESRRLCEISKQLWEERKSCLWISTLSTVAPFPRLFFMTLSSARAAFVDTVFAMGGWPVAAQPAFALRPGFGRSARRRGRPCRDLFVDQPLATVTDLHLRLLK